MHMRAAGTVLNVRTRLALMPGGGSKVKIREPLSRFTGTCKKKRPNSKIYTQALQKYTPQTT